MINIDFKTYHVRAMNAKDEQERVQINNELKFVYESLAPENKIEFNKQLESFLIKEFGSIKSVFEGIASNQNEN